MRRGETEAENQFEVESELKVCAPSFEQLKAAIVYMFVWMGGWEMSMVIESESERERERHVTAVWLPAKRFFDLKTGQGRLHTHT